MGNAIMVSVKPFSTPEDRKDARLKRAKRLAKYVAAGKGGTLNAVGTAAIKEAIMTAMTANGILENDGSPARCECSFRFDTIKGFTAIAFDFKGRT
jgi:hypothetical protein